MAKMNVSSTIVVDKFARMYELIESGTKVGLMVSSSFLQARVIDKITAIPLVDSGRMRGSISYTVYPDKAYALVGTNVEYAPHHEYGTSKMKARPFLRPTFDENKGKIREMIRNEIEKKVATL